MSLYSKDDETVLVNVPFQVLDMAVGLWIAGEIIAYSANMRLKLEREATSSGHAKYVLHSGRHDLWHVHIRAISVDRSSMQLVVFRDESPDTPADTDTIRGYLTSFWKWFMRYISEANKLADIASLDSPLKRSLIDDFAGKIKQSRRPGPPPSPVTTWLESQLRLGRKLDDLLEEYMKLKGEDYDDEEQRRKSRQNLRKTAERIGKWTS